MLYFLTLKNALFLFTLFYLKSDFSQCAMLAPRNYPELSNPEHKKPERNNPDSGNIYT